MASAAFSPDPFVGTWKLDRENSKFSQGAPPREMTLEIEQEGDNLRIKAHGNGEDGLPQSVEYTLPVKGGMDRFAMDTLIAWVPSTSVITCARRPI
jgi:hypothetical protein